MIIVSASSPDDHDSVVLLGDLSEALAKITGNSGRSSFQASDVKIKGSLFVIAKSPSGTPLGCGAYRPLYAGIAEIKRMYAAPGTKGVGAAILHFLQNKAVEDGYRELWLETRLVNQRAIRFYENHGFKQIPNYGKYAGKREAICFSISIPL